MRMREHLRFLKIQTFPESNIEIIIIIIHFLSDTNKRQSTSGLHQPEKPCS